jgi:hypothetical protein
MSTPGFTAEASLSRVTGHHRQARWALGDPQERLDMAQIGVAPLPVQPRLPDELNIIYGNWCGNNRGSGIPVDRVDQVCCRHDKCYDRKGNLSCSCDRDLIRDMPAAMAHESTPRAGRIKGAEILAFFALDPLCLCHQIRVPRLGFPPWRWADAPFPVPGIPPLKICPFPYG